MILRKRSNLFSLRGTFQFCGQKKKFMLAFNTIPLILFDLLRA